MTKFQDLYDFIDRAKRNRKYPEATAYSLRAAINLYDTELSDEEKSSLEKVKKDFEQITQSVFSKNASRFNASSLTTYKSRVLKVFADYEKYGDPAKMSNWTPKVITRTKRNRGNGFQASGSPSGREQQGDSVPESEYPYVFSDKGTGWNLTIRSSRPMDSEIKIEIVKISGKLNEINRHHENKIT